MTSSLTKAVCRLIVIASLITGCATTALALDLEKLRSDAEAGNAVAQRTLGEALILETDGVAADVSAGTDYLERAISQGDAAAKAVLGTLLLDGVFLSQDATRGTILLQEAAAAGNTTAMANLGAARLWGTIIEQDTMRAAALLGKAAEKGDATAKRILGEAMIVGLVEPKDKQTGLRLMQEAATSGDADAQVALGKLLLYGQEIPADLNRATALFEAAATAGNGEGLEELGSHLMWNKRRRSQAETYLRRAGELGRVSAWETLAEGAMYGYLGTTQRDRFDEFAEKARDAGSERIEVLNADRFQWGITRRASGPEAIAILESAADQGNQTALKALIALVRNGNDYNVRKRPAQARRYLERFAEMLSPEEVDYYALSIDAAQTLTGSGFAALSERYRAKNQYLRAGFAKDIYAANPNLVIYMLQADMKDRGEYHGRVNGLATQTTINALTRACRDLPYARDCANDALAPGVISDLLTR